jgi:hypothetical protein
MISKEELLSMAIKNAEEESLKVPMSVVYLYYVANKNEYTTLMSEKAVKTFLEVEGKDNPKLVAKFANGQLIK